MYYYNNSFHESYLCYFGAVGVAKLPDSTLNQDIKRQLALIVVSDIVLDWILHSFEQSG